LQSRTSQHGEWMDCHRSGDTQCVENPFRGPLDIDWNACSIRRAKDPEAPKLLEVGDAASLVCERSSDPLLLPLQKLIHGLQGGRFGDLVLSG